jgi:NADH:ubiquinone oxidoreductase subunit 6 (subunit J)
VLILMIVASEPSKVPFYIAGAVLVIYALVVAGLGLTQPEFPGSIGRARGLMALSVILMLVAVLAGILTDP